MTSSWLGVVGRKGWPVSASWRGEWEYNTELPSGRGLDGTLCVLQLSPRLVAGDHPPYPHSFWRRESFKTEVNGKCEIFIFIKTTRPGCENFFTF